ncbi:hypothetical protein HYV49_04130 [Candidatus Pacearchaeota archaeon]|nr:hypothetical protein [Candidatus Pacearchaeota archaeon]
MDKRGINRKLRVFLTLIACIVFILSVYSLTLVISNLTGYSLLQNSIQEFAACLSDKGVVFYIDDNCQQCEEQKKLFDNFDMNINYINCNANKYACHVDSVDFVPSFKFKEKLYKGVFSLNQIAEITGC